MAVPAGIDIAVSFTGAGYTTKVTSISLTMSAAALDTTGANETSDFDSYVAGRRSITGTFACKWDSTLNLFGTTDPADFGGLGGSGSTVTLTFSADSTPATIAFSAFITSIEPTGGIDAANEVSFSFQGTGAPTVVLGVV